MFNDKAAHAVAVVEASDSTAVVAGRPPRRAPRLPVAQDTPASPYAPGALRKATDVEHGRVVRFCEAHPEYVGRLGYEGLRQVAATYLDEEDRAVRGEMRAAGVPAGWHRVESDDVNPRWSDES